ncbi:MAG: hypothetical protein PHP52_03935 [Bacteroidales bacterium]|nr:hypothetical protein [Bacteroidales bacterium]MDD4217821.1 hypothetical protein [Bacteroidales bacterium]MDY0142092.1 hypothetical protein [Bacteroidales bacterium]
MKYINGISRNQLVVFPQTMDLSISENNEVRLIDLFIDSLDINKMGFKKIIWKKVVWSIS